MKTTMTCLCTASIALPGFMPNVRVDHENRPSHGCYHADIAVSPAGADIYVAIENDSFAGMVAVRSDIYFQKSTDAGRTWLDEDLLIKRGALFACYPDLTLDRDGNIYLVYTERPAGTEGHLYCVRSTDGGATWTPPKQIDDNSGFVKIGWARVAADSADNLFAAWNQPEGRYLRIFSATSTDYGVTWSPRVRVDDDTVPSDAFHTDVFVQPGTNHYLVAATAPYWAGPGYINSNSVCYRSTDQGLTWSAGAVLDTFSGYCGQPHVVADEHHIICDFSGSASGNQMKTESRTLYCRPDTWGPTVAVTDLDTTYSSYLNGGKLAIDPSGRVHVCLMICDLVNWEYNTYYTASTDHGASWAPREIVNDVTYGTQCDPNIAVDPDGNAYVIWQDQRNNRDEIWFSTNNLLGVAEGSSRPQAPSLKLTAEPSVFTRTTTIRFSSSPIPSPQPLAPVLTVFDASGRLVRTLSLPSSPAPCPYSLSWDGTDQSGLRLPAGLYVLRYGTATAKVMLLPVR